jgi:hypothetical protein
MSDGGAERDRTADLMLAKHALSQLSYSPKFELLAASFQPLASSVVQEPLQIQRLEAKS